MSSRFAAPIWAALLLSYSACEKGKPVLATIVTNSPEPQSESAPSTTPTPAQSPLKRLSLVQIAAKISPSVVTLTAHNSEGEKLKMGTGFFMHRSGEIATNWHVISGANNVTATTSTGEVLQVAVVDRYDPELDLALCSVSQSGDGNFPAFTTYLKKLPPTGTAVAVLGNPEGLEHSLSEGIVSAIRRDTAGTLIQITAAISHGSSGSPVVDNTGSLVGVAGATYREGQNLNFARSVLDLAAIWHNLRPQTFAEVAKERFLQFSKNPEAQKFFGKYESNSLREKARLALALREAFPDLAGSYLATSAVFMERENYQRAIEELEQARLFSPNDPTVWQAFGNLYDKIGQRDRAQNSFRRAKQLRDAEAKMSKSSAATIAQTRAQQPHKLPAPSWTPRIWAPKPTPSPFSSLFPPLPGEPAAPDR